MVPGGCFCGVTSSSRMKSGAVELLELGFELAQRSDNLCFFFVGKYGDGVERSMQTTSFSDLGAVLLYFALPVLATTSSSSSSSERMFTGSGCDIFFFFGGFLILALDAVFGPGLRGKGSIQNPVWVPARHIYPFFPYSIFLALNGLLIWLFKHGLILFYNLC